MPSILQGWIKRIICGHLRTVRDDGLPIIDDHQMLPEQTKPPRSLKGFPVSYISAMQATPIPSGKLALPQVISNRPYPLQITTIMFTFTVAFILALVVIPTLSHPLDISSLRTHGDVLANRKVPGHGLRLSSLVLCPRKSIVVDIQREQELARLKLTTDRRIQDLQAHLAGETAALRGGASAKSGKSAKAGKRTNTGKGTKSQGTGAFLKAYETPERRIATIAKHFSRKFDGESGEVRKLHSLI